MSNASEKADWGRGDSVTRALLALASAQPLPVDTVVGGGLIELGRRHGLIGVLAHEVQDGLVRAIQARQRARRQVMVVHLERILILLEDAGVRASILKGPSVAALYDHPDQRPFSDLDLLIEEEALADALAVLDGYEGIVEIPEKRPKASKRDIVMGDASGVRFNVDLHWDLFSYNQFRGSTKGATTAAWDGAKPSTDSELGPSWVLPDGFTVGFLATHAVLDHRFRLILFRDLVEAARRGLDWDGVADVAHRWGLRSTTYLAWFIAEGATGADVPSGFLDEVRPSYAAVRYLEKAIPHLDLARFDGHTPHPVNLASVVLNDSVRHRSQLLLRAPRAFPGWRRRVTETEEAPPTPRTVIVVSTDRRRGAEVFTERLRSGLGGMGWVVDAVALRGTGDRPRASVEALTPDDGRRRGRFEWRIVRALRRNIRAYGPQLIIANGGATLRYSLAARLGTRAKIAYIGIGEPQYWMRSRLSRWVNRLMLNSVDYVIAVSETTRRQLMEVAPSVEAKSATLYTGLERTLIETPRRPAQRGGLRVVVVGSLTPEKDPILALRSVAPIEDAMIRFVGGGHLAQDLASEALRLGCADRVELFGSVEDVRPHLEWADVLLLTSRTEGLPGAVLEASAMAIATVAVDVGGVSEAVVHGESGFVTARDQSTLTARLRELDDDRELLSHMGEAGRRHVEENFLLEDVVERYSEHLGALVK